MTIIDIGANRGQFALFARDHFPSADVICFEPLENARTVLGQVFAHDTKVKVLPYALGSRRGEADLHVTRSDDSSSLLPVTARQREAFPQSEEVARETVTVARLDEVLSGDQIRRPCLVKIDVQGGELDVLQGSTEILPAVDALLVECSFVELYSGQALIDEVIEYLRGHGFRLAGTGSPTFAADRRPLQVDAVFERPSAAGGP